VSPAVGKDVAGVMEVLPWQAARNSAGRKANQKTFAAHGCFFIMGSPPFNG
jgi:hypothetical protein